MKDKQPPRTRLDRRLERQAARALKQQAQEPKSKPKRVDGRRAK